MVEVLPSRDITSLLNPTWVRRASVIPVAATGLVLVISALVLLGWILNSSALTTFSSSWVSMKLSSAIALFFCATSLRLLHSKRTSPGGKRAAVVLAAFAGLIGVATLIEYHFPLRPQIDPFVFNEVGDDSVPNRMPPLGAFCLILSSVAIVNSRFESARGHPLSHLLALPIALISALPLIAYFYGARFLTGLAAYSDIAPHTALCFLAISLALIFARLDHDLAAVLLSDGPGGMMARRLLPVAILVPLLLGWVRVLAEDGGWFSSSFGTAFFATATIGGFVIFIWRQSLQTQRAELAFREASYERERLRIQGEMRDQFVSMLSHDLRTPITAATLSAQLIERAPDRSDFCRSRAETIVHSLARADRMIQSILDVQRIRTGQALELAISECDLWVIADSVVRELTAIHGARFALKRTEDLVGYWDAEAIRRALENLCNNAVKYGAKDTTITVSIESLAESLRLTVHNEGPSIPKEEQEGLFEPFRRAKSAKSTGNTGWGIGLAQVRGMAAAHGGRAWVESSREHGTTFGIELPRDSRPDAVSHAAS